jgi:hypothetical protein
MPPDSALDRSTYRRRSAALRSTGAAHLPRDSRHRRRQRAGRAATEGDGTRGFIAGVLPNTPENMVRWLRHPQAVNQKSAMPDLGVTERDALGIAAYLSTC